MVSPIKLINGKRPINTNKTGNKTKAGIRCQVKPTFHFFVNAIHISTHNPGKASATGPLASVASPSAAVAIYNCEILLSCNHVNALNKPSVIKNIKYGSGTASRNSNKK